jgi:hypothetical protein
VDPAPVWEVLVFVVIKQPGAKLDGQRGESRLVAQQLTLGRNVVIVPR